jgi:hypothetical protein
MKLKVYKDDNNTGWAWDLVSDESVATWEKGSLEGVFIWEQSIGLRFDQALARGLETLRLFAAGDRRIW